MLGEEGPPPLTLARLKAEPRVINMRADYVVVSPNRRAYMQGPAHRLERRACAALITYLGLSAQSFLIYQGALPPETPNTWGKAPRFKGKLVVAEGLPRIWGPPSDL